MITRRILEPVLEAKPMPPLVLHEGPHVELLAELTRYGLDAIVSHAPVLAALGVDLGIPLIGAVTVESIFGWPGLGREALLATLELDIPLVLGVVLACAFAIAVVTLVMDLAILAVDPRARGA
jgi:ABC-type antimicrobial peptide transport system permease subunit